MNDEKEILMDNVKLIRKQCAGLSMRARQNAVRVLFTTTAIYRITILKRMHTTAKKKRPTLNVSYKLNGISVCKGTFGFAYIVSMIKLNIFIHILSLHIIY
jgi:hypothetical protein